MLQVLFALASSELGVSSSTINIVLLISASTVIALPLLFALRSKKLSSKVKVTLY